MTIRLGHWQMLKMALNTSNFEPKEKIRHAFDYFKFVKNGLFCLVWNFNLNVEMLTQLSNIIGNKTITIKKRTSLSVSWVKWSTIDFKFSPIKTI